MNSPKESLTKRIVLWTIAILILLPASYGFAEKLMLFVLAVRRDLIGGITIVPVVNYLIVTAGMVCLLFWGVAHGMFRDIEKPKYDMLEREEKLEAEEHLPGSTTP